MAMYGPMPRAVPMTCTAFIPRSKMKTFAIELRHATRSSEFRLEFARVPHREDAVRMASRKWQGFVVALVQEL